MASSNLVRCYIAEQLLLQTTSCMFGKFLEWKRLHVNSQILQQQLWNSSYLAADRKRRSSENQARHLPQFLLVSLQLGNNRYCSAGGIVFSNKIENF